MKSSKAILSCKVSTRPFKGVERTMIMINSKQPFSLSSEIADLTINNPQLCLDCVPVLIIRDLSAPRT